MSGGGSIGKVFSKVAKTVVKVAPVVLAAAAVVFTAGAALGALPTLGAAMTSVFGSTGLGGVLAGALTQAAYGSAIGALMAGVTGGNVMKGMQMGALSGAVTGGVTGGMNLGAENFAAKIDPIGSWSENSLVPSADKVGGTATGGEAGSIIQGNAPAAAPGAEAAVPANGPVPSPVPANPGVNVGPAASGAKVATVGAETAAKPTGLLAWMDAHPGATSLGGNVIGGLGQGLMGMGAADAEKEAAALKVQGELDMRAAEQSRIASNYSNVGRGGLLTPENMAYLQQDSGGRRPTPTQRFDPRAYGGEWKFDQSLGRVVFVPNAGTA